MLASEIPALSEWQLELWSRNICPPKLLNSPTAKSVTKLADRQGQQYMAWTVPCSFAPSAPSPGCLPVRWRKATLLNVSFMSLSTATSKNLRCLNVGRTTLFFSQRAEVWGKGQVHFGRFNLRLIFTAWMFSSGQSVLLLQVTAIAVGQGWVPTSALSCSRAWAGVSGLWFKWDSLRQDGHSANETDRSLRSASPWR